MLASNVSCSWTSYIHFTIHERIAYNIALPLQEILSGNRDRDLCMKSGLNREWIVDKYYPPLTILRWEGNCVNRPAVPPPFSSSSFFSLLLLLLLFNSRRLIARESFFLQGTEVSTGREDKRSPGRTRMTAGISSRREIIRFLAPPARPPATGFIASQGASRRPGEPFSREYSRRRVPRRRKQWQ